MKSKALFAASSCIMAILAQPAASQVSGDTVQAADDDGALTDIVVTARRRSENLQDVPISITAYTAEGLKDRGVASLRDMTNFTPNLEINNGRTDGGGSTAQIYIRGVGQNDYLIPNDPGVGLYIDDVYVARSTGAVVGLSDIQSVEILRGPQGTLYGKNTIGGAVRITSVAPAFDEFSGRVAMTVGSYSRLDFSGSVNLPIAENFAVRVAGSSRNTDDLIDRYLDPRGDGQGNINQDAIRMIARWAATSNLEITVAGDYTRTRQHAPYGGNILYVPGGSALIDALNDEVYPGRAAQYDLPPGTIFDERWATAPDRSGATGSNSDNYDVWGVSGTIVYSLSDTISLKSITAYRSVKGFAGRDADGSPFPVVDTISRDDNSQFSEEIQLNGSSFDDRFKWTLGFYYIRENLENRVTALLWDGLLESSVNIDFNARSRGKLKGTSLAVFGQGTFDVTDRLHLTVGGRYNKEKKDFNNRWFFVEQPREFTCPGIDVNGNLDNCKSTDNVFTPMASIGFDVTRDILLYASYSEGFKAGGWTPRLFSQQSLKRFRPEKLKAYEAGFKSTLFDRRLVLNAAIFQSDYSDLQLTSVLADSQGSPQPVVENAGSARIRGIEIEATARIGTGTTIQAGLGHLDAEYIRLDPGVSFPLSAKLPDTPPLTLTGSIEQVVPLPNNATIAVRADASYKGKTYKDPANAEVIAQRAFTLLNARITYRSADERWSLAAFGTNLLDKTYITNALDIVSTFGFYEAYFGRPREFGAELTVNF
jgi:iron complex outermembrane receptor protein